MATKILYVKPMVEIGFQETAMPLPTRIVVSVDDAHLLLDMLNEFFKSDVSDAERAARKAARDAMNFKDVQ